MSQIIHIGIDFGTTKVIITKWENNGSKPEFIKDTNGDIYIESSIAITNGKVSYVGQQASDYPESRKIIDNKRFIGRTFSSIPSDINFSKYAYDIKKGSNDTIYYELPKTDEYDPCIITPLEVASVQMKYIKQQIDRVCGQTNKTFTITVPAYFDSEQKKATVQAGNFVFMLISFFMHDLLLYPINANSHIFNANLRVFYI